LKPEVDCNMAAVFGAGSTDSLYPGVAEISPLIENWTVSAHAH